MISEHFNPLVRALKAKQPVRLRVDVAARFTDEADQPGYNTLAEIRGSSKPDEVVMIGAHLDSWHSGTGAADNAAGVAVMMEAMRILKATGAKPKRTIRVALWSGEEQGLIGSQAYVAKHFGRFPEPTDPPRRRCRRPARANRCAAEDPRLQQVPGLLQHGQRLGPVPWHLRAGKPGGDADLRSLAGPVP